jgi:hypothetical protein
MKLKLISVCILFVTIFLSCKKEDLLIVENSDALLLSAINLDNQPSITYLYNDANLVIEEKSKFDFTIHHYNDKNQLTSSDCYGNFDILSSDLQVSTTAMNRKEWVTANASNNGGTINYEYNDNGQLIKSTYIRPSSGISEYSGFSYDANNRISRQMLYWENAETGYIDYSYDEKGNLIKEILYNLTSSGVAELNTTTQYAFDNELNPYKSFSRLMLPGIYTNRNNITKETYTINLKAEQLNDKVLITETSYQYNSNGYPTSKNGNTTFIYK